MSSSSMIVSLYGCFAGDDPEEALVRVVVEVRAARAVVEEPRLVVARHPRG